MDGKQIALKRISTTECSRNAYKSIYKGSGYTLVLTTRILKQPGDEEWIEGGSVDISQGLNKVKIMIHGEAGC